MSNADLNGQVAIVTGSSEGIGRAAAARLHAQGAAVVLNGRDPDRLQGVADAMVGPAPLRAVAGDASKTETVDRLVAAARELGGVDITVANVGGGTVGAALADLTPELLADSYRRNVAGTIELIRAVSPWMVQHSYGRIVTVASLAGRRFGRVSGPDYSAHKAAVVGLTRHAAAELAPAGVTVNCVAPGIIDTPRARAMVEALGPDAQDRILAGTPAGRWGRVDEVAAAICFLASPDASYITGHTLDVNGGAHMN